MPAHAAAFPHLRRHSHVDVDRANTRKVIRPIGHAAFDAADIDLRKQGAGGGNIDVFLLEFRRPFFHGRDDLRHLDDGVHLLHRVGRALGSPRSLGLAEGRDLDLTSRRDVVRLVEGVGVGAVSATDPWHLEEGGTVSILWDTRRGAEWLSVLQEAADVENLYIVTKEKSVFKKLTDELKETLPPLIRPEEVMLPMKQGFAENLAYYDLGFLDPGEVARGKQFAAILPLLWMMAGAKAECPKAGRINDWLLAPECTFAVLHKEELFEDFNAELKGHPEIVHVFLVTDSEESFAEMRSGLRKSIQATMLYSSYLRNFSINSRA